MDDEFYDSLEEDSFCECQSQVGEENLKPNDLPPEEPESPDNITDIIPLYQREIPKNTVKTLKKENRCLGEVRKMVNRDPLPVKDKKQNRTYLNLFHTKIKYPTIGGGDVVKWKSGSDTTRANYDPSSRKGSAVASENVEEFFADNECSSDEESFYEKFIAEEEIKTKNAEQGRSNLLSTSGTISNFLSVSEQCLSKTKLDKPKTRKRNSTKASSLPNKSQGSGMDDYSNKLQLLRKRQYYGQRASSRNRAIMEENQIMKSFKTKLKI